MSGLSRLTMRHMARARIHLVHAALGLVVGVATLTFFLGLSQGVRQKVLNRLYPVNQVEFQPEKVRLFGMGMEVPSRLDDAVLKAIRSRGDVTAVFPKQRSRFQARLWGGADILGTPVRVEAFFDGIQPGLVAAELRQAEAAVLGREDSDAACAGHSGCGVGAVCREGRCARKTWWDQFVESGTPEYSCRLGSPGVQVSDDREALRGRVTGSLSGLRREGLPEACPQGQYCAARALDSADGVCARPIPVILSPFLLDVYNDVAAGALGMRKLSGLEVALGVEFAIMYGESYFMPDEPVGRRVVRRCRVVGFSPRAMDFGVTMPLQDVVDANAMLRPESGPVEYSSVIVQAAANEDVPALVEDMKVLGLVLAPKSEAGRKAANVLTILTLIFAGVSGIILLISAINISHTFLMLVTERRREIAIYRAVGASAMQIRVIVWLEAALLGLAGGAVGCLAGWVFSLIADALASRLVSGVPGSPSSFFQFDLWMFALCLSCSILFSIVGAHGPSRDAARTDPAGVLAQN